MQAHGLGGDDGQAADQLFHRVLFAASGNAALASLSSSVAAAVRWTTHYKQRASKSPRDGIPDHEDVLLAIEASDELLAESAMRRLLDLALADMFKSLPIERS